MMKRLTKRNEDGSVSSAINCPDGCKYFTCSMEEGQHCSHECEADYMCKLAEYEDLEEQGLLLKLPCKIGNVVYEVIDYLDCKYDYNCPLSFSQGAYDCENGLHCRHEYKKYFVSEAKFNHHMIDEIGKTIFLTKEEAEEKLKKLTK